MFYKRDQHIPPGIYENILKEMQDLSTLYPEKDQLMSRLCDGIRKILGDIFDLRHEFTFEELTEKVDSFYDVVLAAEQEINSIKKELDSLKKQAGSKDALAKMRNISQSLHEAKERKKKIYYLADRLTNEALKRRLKSFVTTLSQLSYSQATVSPAQVKQLLDEFIALINEIYKQDTPMKKDSAWESISSLFSAGRQDSITLLLQQAEAHMARKDTQQAYKLYRQLIIEYEKIPEEQKKEVYKRIYSIWAFLSSQGALTKESK